MRSLYSITRRNITLYLSSKSAVFFSLLASVITISIFFLFLGKLYTSDFTNYGISESNASVFMSLWVLGGILSINSMSIPQTVLSQIIADRESNTLSDFYVTPINRTKLVLGYLLSSIICASIINFFIFLLGELYLLTSFGFSFDVLTHIYVFVCLILFTFVYPSMLYTLYMFVKNSKALGGISAFVSSIGGFLAGIYISIGMLTGTVKNIISLNPLAHTTSLFRIILLRKHSSIIFDGAPDDLMDNIYESIGVYLYYNDTFLSPLYMFLSLFVTFVLFYLLSLYKTKHDKIK